MRIVPAIEPDLRALGRGIDQRPVQQPLQPRRPFDIVQAPFDGVLARPTPADAPERRDGNGGIGDLMAALKLGQRQIEQAVVVLINQAAMFFMRVEILAINEKRRAQLVGACAR